MKQWLRKVIKSPDLQDQQPEYSKNKNKKVIVSFDKHIEKISTNTPQQKTKNKHYTNNQEYEEDYSPRRQSNFSNCVEYDESQCDLKFSKQNTNHSKHQSKFTHNKKIDISKFQQDQEAQLSQESDPEMNSSDEEKHQLNPSQEISQQIVNSLISMQDLIKMIKPIPEIKGEYITLRLINKLLTIAQKVNKTQLSNYMLSKSSEGVNAYFNKQENQEKQKSYRRIVKKLIKRKHNSKSQSDQSTRSQSIQKFFFRTFSNGLIYQYYPVRALIWKITSGYLPESKEKWIWKMEVSLLKYRQLVKKYICEPILKKKKNTQKINPDKDSEKKQNTKQNDQNLEIRKKSQTYSDPLSRITAQKKNQKDHPLNLKQDSKWKTYFEDFQLWNLIQKDTIRTRQTYSFFKEANVFSLTNDEPFESNLVVVQLQNNQKVEFRLNELHLSKVKKDCTTYIDALTRIIFIYIKVNPQQKYHQGINQLVAVIYYSLTNKNNEYFRRVSESDTYEIFMLLMTQLNTHPLHSVENMRLPIFNHFISGERYFDLLRTMIQKYDFRLHDFLNNNKGFEYLKAISIRWFLTIFLSELSLDEALVLWDCVMILIDVKPVCSSQRGHALKGVKLTEFVLYMALAVIHLNRNEIYPENSSQVKDCSNILIIFQKINQKPEEIIQKAINLYKSFPNLLQ